MRADPGQVEQIVLNLAVNARDAMPSGGRITVATDNVVLDEEFCRHHPPATEGEHVQLAVTDTGVGIDAETLDHIFEPFFTTKGATGGTGLGLSTVYGIVTQHGGLILIDSELGQGTTFKVYFPRVDATAEALPARKVTTDMPPGAETILVVEDESVVRTLAVRVLRRLGYEVLESDRGADALHIAQGHDGPIHLLLTDVIMPLMNGRELAERLEIDRPDVRVLFTSGYTDDVIAPHGVLDGESHFIAKPYTPRKLARKVRTVLDER